MNVTLIGVGGLGSALAAGLVEDPSLRVTLCARRPGTLDPFRARAHVTDDVVAAVAAADVVVLAVKPKGIPELFSHLESAVRADAVVVSCAAGVSVDRLVGRRGVAVARAMPNIGAHARVSTTAIYLGGACIPARDRPRLEAVFRAVGDVKEVVDEGALHAVTAVAASGPAFLLLAVEALVDAGVEQGMSRPDAIAFARGALIAAAARLPPATEPSTTRTTVTSPAGTTAAGLAALEDRAVRAAFADAVRAAVARSRQL